MNVEQFIADFRRDMDDAEEPYLWSTEFIVSALNTAVDEACERAKLIEDRTTAEVCTINLQVGVTDYRLHAAVLEVKRLTLRGRPLCETSVEELDSHDCGWESRTGTPRWWIQDYNGGLRLVPQPVLAEAIHLTVYRTPLEPLSADIDSGEPEIKPILHKRLLPWLYREAYLQTDTETYDAEKAARHEATFERSFGARPDANVQRKRIDKRPPVTRMIF